MLLLGYLCSHLALKSRSQVTSRLSSPGGGWRCCEKGLVGGQLGLSWTPQPRVAGVHVVHLEWPFPVADTGVWTCLGHIPCFCGGNA